MPDRIGREALSLQENGTCFSTRSFNSEPICEGLKEGIGVRVCLEQCINEILTPAPPHHPPNGRLRIKRTKKEKPFNSEPTFARAGGERGRESLFRPMQE